MALLPKSRARARKQAALAKAAPIAGIAAAAGALVFVSRRLRALVAGKSKAAANAVTPSPARDYDDVTLARKVETEIFRDADAPKGDVNVNAENGVVYLRGQVKNQKLMKELEAKAREVDGVKEVDNLLSLPGTEPIMKTEGKVRSVATR